MHMLINNIIKIIMFRPNYFRKIIKDLTLLKTNIVEKEFVKKEIKEPKKIE